jgi:hypothetical protein
MVVSQVAVVRGLIGAILALGGLLLVRRPDVAPIAVLIALATAVWPIGCAWVAARGTALRPAIVWSAVALVLGIAAQVCALNEPLSLGRPWAGHFCYVTVLAVLAGLVSVLNARTPGGGAWAILMVLLILLFLIPWLEGPGIARHAHGAERLRLDAPWTIFYGLLVIAGVTNYLPTRYGVSVCWLAFGLVHEYLALTRPGWSASRKALTWSVVPWTVAVGLWSAYDRSGRGRAPSSVLGRAWLWFRDHWGVVWALRVKERFNRQADVQHWPIRISWYGVVPAGADGDAIAASHGAKEDDGRPSVLEAAESTFRTLIRRFAEPERIAAVEGCDAGDSCELTPPRPMIRAGSNGEDAEASS